MTQRGTVLKWTQGLFIASNVYKLSALTCFVRIASFTLKRCLSVDFISLNGRLTNSAIIIKSLPFSFRQPFYFILFQLLVKILDSPHSPHTLHVHAK